MNYEKKKVKEKIRTIWEEEKNEFYGKVLDEFNIESGDISPGNAHDLNKKEEELITVLTNWILSRSGSE